MAQPTDRRLPRDRNCSSTANASVQCFVTAFRGFVFMFLRKSLKLNKGVNTKNHIKTADMSMGSCMGAVSVSCTGKGYKSEVGVTGQGSLRQAQRRLFDCAFPRWRARMLRSRCQMRNINQSFPRVRVVE